MALSGNIKIWSRNVVCIKLFQFHYGMVLFLHNNYVERLCTFAILFTVDFTLSLSDDSKQHQQHIL